MDPFHHELTILALLSAVGRAIWSAENEGECCSRRHHEASWNATPLPRAIRVYCVTSVTYLLRGFCGSCRSGGGVDWPQNDESAIARKRQEGPGEWIRIATPKPSSVWRVVHILTRPIAKAFRFAGFARTTNEQNWAPHPHEEGCGLQRQMIVDSDPPVNQICSKMFLFLSNGHRMVQIFRRWKLYRVPTWV